MMVAGDPVTVRWDPCPYSPIHDDDIFGQLEAILGLASTPATIVNWGGDERVAPPTWCPYLAELAGIEGLSPSSSQHVGIRMGEAVLPPAG